MSRLKALLEALRGRGTIREYPLKPLPAPEGFRGLPRIDPGECIGCGACTLICPSQALRRREGGEEVVIEYFAGRCIFCAMCWEVCPQNAITITREYELAALDENELKTEVSNRMAICEYCSRGYATEKALARVREVIGDQPYLDYCIECRRLLFLKALSMGRR